MELTPSIEFEIPLPWGNMTIKTWGIKSDSPILLFHGFMDNIGTFDRLIPHLSQSFFYICPELPGHGKSSPIPPFFPYYTLDMLLVYKVIMDYFKTEKNNGKYIVMGHSYGAGIAYILAQLYPDHFEALIMLESIYLFPMEVDIFRDLLRQNLDLIITIEEKRLTQKVPTYTYTEAWKKIQDVRSAISDLNDDAAKALAKRAIEPYKENSPSSQDQKYVFTVDQRLKAGINPFLDMDFIIGTIKRFPVLCPILMVLALENEFELTTLKPILEVHEKSKNIEIKYVEGSHDVHNNDPKTVGDIVNEFLIRHTNKAKL